MRGAGTWTATPKRRRSFASGWTPAACSMHRRPWTPHHPRNPRENPLPRAPRKPSHDRCGHLSPVMDPPLGSETPQDDARAMVDRLRGRDKTILQDAIEDRDRGEIRPSEFKEIVDMVAKRNPVKADGPAKTPPAALRKVKERLAMEEGKVLAHDAAHARRDGAGEGVVRGGTGCGGRRQRTGRHSSRNATRLCPARKGAAPIPTVTPRVRSYAVCSVRRTVSAIAREW